MKNKAGETKSQHNSSNEKLKTKRKTT